VLVPSLDARSRMVRATVGGRFLTVIAFMLHLAALCILKMHAAILYATAGWGRLGIDL
jgi:hypothetical protein